MPYPTEHACRIRPPGAFQRFSRDNDKNPNVILGYPDASSKSGEVQAYRYPITTWDAKRAMEHCKGHNGRFEAAAPTKASEDIVKNMIFFEIELKEGQKEYLVLPKGKFQHPSYGNLDFSDTYIDELIKNFHDGVLGNTKPFVDQDHDEKGAAGWFNDLKKTADGMVGVIEWTKNGVELLTEKIYRYFSPWISSYTNPESGKRFRNVFRGGALTNVPFLKNLPEIALSETGKKFYFNQYDKGAIQMDELLKNLKKIFSIEADDDELAATAVLEKVEALQKQGEQFSELETKVKDQETKVKEQAEELEKLKKSAETKMAENKDDDDKRFTELQEENSKLREDITIMKRDKCIGKALSEGRMLPNQVEFYNEAYMKDPDLMEKNINQLAEVVELKEKGHSQDKKKKIVLEELDEDSQKVHGMFGHTQEDIEKYGEDSE